MKWYTDRERSVLYMEYIRRVLDDVIDRKAKPTALWPKLLCSTATATTS